MIRKPVYELVNAHYEIFETDEAEAPVGKASVVEGLIESLMVKNGVSENFHGQILNRLLRAILEDADHHNSNLSIKVAKPDAVRLKRFLERFGFKEAFTGIYKRTSGSSLPSTVLY